MPQALAQLLGEVPEFTQTEAHPASPQPVSVPQVLAIVLSPRSWPSLRVIPSPVARASSVVWRSIEFEWPRKEFDGGLEP